MLQNLRIRSKLLAVVAVPVTVLLIVAIISFTAFQAIKVNGATYNRIIRQKDLVADVLPPAMYVSEPYSESIAMIVQLQNRTNDPFNTTTKVILKQKRENILRLQKDFETRYKFWEKELNNVSDQQVYELLGPVYTTGHDFYAILVDQFISTVENKDLKADVQIETLIGIRDQKLNPLFVEHGAAVDKLIKISQARQIALEKGARNVVRERTLLLIGTLIAAILLTALIGAIVARLISRPIIAMTDRATHVANVSLPNTISAMNTLAPGDSPPELVEFPVVSNNELGQLAQAFNAVQSTAVDLAAKQVLINRNYGENLITIGRRNQGLVFRTLSLITELEQNERDPEMLENLFRLDHLTTRMRRQAESLLVLAGDQPSSTSGAPVDIADVVRGALSEVDEYHRVDQSDMDAVTIRGRNVHSIVHLFAELIENAISYSPPSARVTLLGRLIPKGYHVAIIDRGIGMSAEDLAHANDRLEEVQSYDLTPVRVLGHQVVARLSKRLNIQVKLHDNLPAPGITASVLLPLEVLGIDASQLPPETPEIMEDMPILSASATVSDKILVAEPSGHIDDVRKDAPVSFVQESLVETASQRNDGYAPYDEEEMHEEPSIRGGERINSVATSGYSEWPAPSGVSLGVTSDESDTLTREETEEAVSATLQSDQDASGQGEMTKTGFRKRVRGAQAPDTGPAPEHEVIQERDAAALRSSLAGLQSGFDRAKRD
jgi:signal transduction histidine kinase